MPGVLCEGVWRLKALRGPILSVFIFHSAMGTASSIPIPIRATDPKTQSSWSLNWSCWSVKNASFTEQLQGAYLNSKHCVPALLKLFFFYFWFSKLQKGLFFIQFRLTFFSNHKIPKSGFLSLIVYSATVYLNQMIQVSALPFVVLTVFFIHLVHPWCALFALLALSYSPLTIKKQSITSFESKSQNTSWLVC